MLKNRMTLTVGIFLCIVGSRLPAQDAKIIDVVDELRCDAAPTVYIGNTIRRVTVFTTRENKVRLVTSVAYKGFCNYGDDEWLDKLELKVSGTPGEVHVKCGNMSPMPEKEFGSSPVPFSPPANTRRTSDLPRRQIPNNLTPNGTVVFDSWGHWLHKEGNIRRNIYIYVPVGSKLVIDSRYAEIILDSNTREVNARITNGSMTMKNVERLVLNSAYGSIYADNIGHAEIGLAHGWFHAKDVPDLEITSRFSTIELGDLGQVKINSGGDQYDIEQAGAIQGEKDYGYLRINTLTKFLDLTGVNADIKVHNIAATVSSVHIDGQYADLRLPVNDLKDYTVHFEGTGSNIFTPFQRTHGGGDSGFNITAGSGKKASFRLKCNNCTVDMK
jgi:hypothetical protein